MAKSDPKIKNMRKVNFSQLVSNGFSSQSFAVTCGDPISRLYVFRSAVADAAALGLPIVIIHNGGPVGDYLNRVTGIDNVGPQNPCYTAFSGMSVPQIINAIANLSGSQPLSAEELNALKIYIQLSFHVSALPGTLNSVFDLVEKDMNALKDTLSRIPGMDSTLRNDVIDYLRPYFSDGNSSSVIRRLRDRLSAIYQKIGTISSTHTGYIKEVSILNTVKNRGIIAIDISQANDWLMDYIAEELSLVNGHFLLACCDLQVEESSAFGKAIIRHSCAKARPLFISSNDILQSYSSNRPGSTFAASLAPRNLLILNCGNAATADPYQKYVGDYFKDVVTQSHSTHRSLHSLIGSITGGSSVTQTLVSSLEKNEFCHPEGCVFCCNDKIIKSKALIYERNY